MQGNNYAVETIADMLGARRVLVHPEAAITRLAIDSRRIYDPEHALFVAIQGKKDGHDFIGDAFAGGVRNFLVMHPAVAEQYKEANFIIVPDTLDALQALTAKHRAAASLQVIGITGSNGKTVVKEWLYQLLAADYNIVRSPKSYNSQIGVPLSVWQIGPGKNLGIFEAGISKPGEMAKLAQIIQPTIGILTNLGEAHAEGFESAEQKLREKLLLFKDVDLFIYAPRYLQDLEAAAVPGKRKFTWSTDKTKADLQVFEMKPGDGKNQLKANYKGEEISAVIPFADRASVENGITCWATLLAMGYPPAAAADRLALLTQVGMRLALKTGINNTSVIDDSYSADISSLAIALDFLSQQSQHTKKTVILSDLYETGRQKDLLYREIAALLQQKSVNHLIGIGPEIQAQKNVFGMETTFFKDTEAFLEAFPGLHFGNESILVKGARKFEFERISKLLTQKIHDTVLEIDLSALTENLNFYKSKLRPGVKIMAMVKAFSYGSGSYEIASLLQFHKVDYLAVAYADEGITLRKAGITLPIMVMSPEPAAFEAIVQYQLEPELYNKEIVEAFMAFLPASETPYPVHIKLDTGMHRLGFEANDIEALAALLEGNTTIKVVSVFSHLAGSASAEHSGFTDLQIERFSGMYRLLAPCITGTPLRHILNTGGITTRPEAQMDMVRLGIGLYGFDSALPNAQALQTVAVLKTTVTQVKTLMPGETVGYERRGMMPQGGTIAIVKIGYADGYARAFGNGAGKMLVNGVLVPTIGAICMDMTMLDVSGVPVKTGDEVIVFNDQLTIAALAAQIGTIPYEILTNISQRVKRVYYYE